MTGYRSKFFRHECQSRGCYVEQLPDWQNIIDCFPRNIRPTDIDGMVEIGGRFLFLEEKQAGKSPDEGQRIAFRRLSMLPGVTVCFFRPGTASDFEVLTYNGERPTGWQPNTEHEFHGRIRRWAELADDQHNGRRSA